MRILILGSGAVGLVLGASLLKSNHDVIFLARGSNLATLRQQGLRVEWPDGETWKFANVHAVEENAKTPDFDAIFFSVKGYDWEEAARILKQYSAPYVFTFQNGVMVHRELAKRIGNRVFASIIYISAERVEPGRVVSKTLSRVILDGSVSARQMTAPLAEALQKDKIKVLLSDDIELDLWRKYLFLCAFSSLNTLTEKPIGPILAEPATRSLLERFLSEMVQIANAEGIGLTAADISRTMEDASKFPPVTTSSLYADFLRKGPTETELLQGNLAALADRHKIDAPVVKTIYALLKLKTQLNS